MSTISIRTKLWAAFATALLLIVVMGMVSLFELRAVNTVAQEGRELWMPRIESARQMKHELAEHWALATRRSQTSDFRQLAAIGRDMNAMMAVLRKLLDAFPIKGATQEERQHISDLRKLYGDYEFVLRKAFQDIDNGELAGARELLRTAAADAVQDSFGKLDKLIENAKEHMQQSAERAANVYALAYLLTIALIITAAGYALGALIWIARNISAPLGNITDAMQRLAVGDASVVVSQEESRRDEIGILADAVAGYRDSLIRSRELSDAAELERGRLHAAVNNMPVGLAMFDGEQRLIICNNRYGEIYQLPAELQKPGSSLRDIIKAWVGLSIPTDTSIDDHVARIVRNSDQTEHSQQLIKLASGRIVNVIRQKLGDGGWVATHEDVTERRRIEERIHHMARHDAVTDLPNRVSFVEKLSDQLRGIARGGNLAVFCLDLDRFKNVNDTLGHPAGDALLEQVADRLRAVTRETDMVARFGGDEFSILQTHCAQPSDVTALAERIIERLSAPYDLHGNQVVIGVSIGIALAPGDGMTADALLKHGDMALYRAKAEGRGTYRLFEHEMDARMHERRELELDLRQALKRDQFEIHYQPIVDLKNGDVSGFEALLRWQHPTRGMIAPADFIPLAEEIGLIVPIGALVLRKACLAAASWPDDIKVAVNISPVQFKSKNILTTVVEALAVSRLLPRRLELEITEGVLLHEAENTLATLHQLRELGVRIAMDDFGTGYSSLSYLRSFPFDKIKIDRSFIANVDQDESSIAIIRAVATLSNSMGIVTTAEGVETDNQLEHVRNEGCSEVQGFLFSPPRPEAELLDVLAKLRRRIRTAA